MEKGKGEAKQPTKKETKEANKLDIKSFIATMIAVIVIIVTFVLFGMSLITHFQNTTSEANIGSREVSTKADNFKTWREVVVYCGHEANVVLCEKGYIAVAVDKYNEQLQVTIKDADGTYRKHLVGLNDNTTYVVRDLVGDR